MSCTIVEQAPARRNRSELAVPGSQPQLFEKAAKSAADVVFLDLEDAVAPDDKPQARKNVIQAINDIDWGTKTLSVRSEEHTSELQSLMRISYAVFCLKNKKTRAHQDGREDHRPQVTNAKTQDNLQHEQQ